MRKHMTFSRSAVLLGSGIFVGGVILGVVVGTILGMLFAPRSGKETRGYLLKQVEKLGGTIADKSEDLIGASKRQVNTALQHGRKVLDHLS